MAKTPWVLAFWVQKGWPKMQTLVCIAVSTKFIDILYVQTLIMKSYIFFVMFETIFGMTCLY